MKKTNPPIIINARPRTIGLAFPGFLVGLVPILILLNIYLSIIMI